MYQYSNECIHNFVCCNHATMWILYQYSNKYIYHHECSHGATRYELFF